MSGIRYEPPVGLMPPQAAAGGGMAANPLGAMADIIHLQTGMSELAGRQRFGQLMAAAPDSETGMQWAMRDPVASPWAGPAINNIRQADLTLKQMQGLELQQGNSLLHTTIANAAPVYNLLLSGDIDGANAALNAAGKLTQVASPTLWAGRGEGIMNGLRESITGGIDPKDPAGGQKAANRFLNLLGTAGIGQAEIAGSIAGENINIDQGAYIQPAKRLTTGQVIPIGQAIPKTQFVRQGEIPVTGGTQIGGPTLATGLPALGAPTPPPTGTAAAPLGAPPATVPPGQLATPAMGRMQAQEAPTAARGAVAGDGTPLWNENTNMEAPWLGTRNPITGERMLSENQQEQSKQASGEWNKDFDIFKNASNQMGSIRYMNNALDSLIARGKEAGGINFLAPGVGLEARTEIANTINTIFQALNEEAPFDTKKVADVEDYNKESVRMLAQFKTGMFGASREAAETLQRIAKGIPGLDGSYLGNKLVLSGIQGVAQREIDRRAFEMEWAKRNGGNVYGATAAFMTQHPASEYANKVLNDMGMRNDGKFQNEAALNRVFEQGYLTKKQADEMFANQFGGAKPAGQ